MALNNIYILTDAVHSGKTTRLQHWLRNRDIQAGGILSPDKNGIRQLYDIGKNEYHPFELTEDFQSDEVYTIGKYHFSKAAFKLAQDILLHEVKNDPDWMIVDEVGKLELDQNAGLEPAVTHLVKHYKNNRPKGRLMLVIRNYLLDEAVMRYGLNTDMIIHKSFFE